MNQQTYEENSTEITDVEASVSFIAQFILDYDNDHVPFHSCSLEHALEEACFAPVESRKVIALYFHNENDAFSKMFCPTLVNGEIRTVLENTFYLLGWDVSDVNYHNALKKSMNESIDCEEVTCFITEKRAALFIIYPIENSVTIYSMLHGPTVKTSEVLSTLKSIEERFKAEINNETELEVLKKKVRSENDIDSKGFQQMMFDRLGDRDYDCFQYDEHDHLKQKIGYALYGPPSSEEGYDKKQNLCIEETYEKIRHYNNLHTKWQDEIFISFIYNCVEPLAEEKLARAKKYSCYNPNTDILPIPLYVIRKCRGSANPCRIFIDSNNRQYTTWHDYIENNKLHQCTMVLPSHGRYSGDENGKVVLERHLSPSVGITSVILRGVDTTSAVAGVASGFVFIAAGMIPAITVAPVVLTAAAVTGTGVGIYSVIRSASNLYDRYVHGENLRFDNSEARGAYVNILAGTLGFVGAGATTVVSQLAAGGVNIGQGAQMAVNTINVVNLSVSGVGVANSTYQIVDDWITEQKKPSLLTVVQLSSSILFFGNAVLNFKTAGTIIDETQTNTLREMQDSLRSNRHRKTYNKLTKETIRVHKGDVQSGRAEVIAFIRRTPNTDEVFALLTRNNKLFNAKGVSFSTENGEIKLNGMSVDLSKFASLSKTQRTQFLIDLPSTAHVAANTNIDTTQTYNTFKAVFDLENIDAIVRYGKLISTGISFTNLVAELLEDYSEVIKEKILRIVKVLIDKLMASADINFFNFQEYFSHIRKEPFFAIIVKLVIHFLKTNMNNYEEKYKKAKQIAEQSDNFDEEEFDKEWGVRKFETGTRIIYWFEKSVHAFFNGTSINEGLLRELIDYVMNAVTEMLYDYCDGEEKTKRREENTKENVSRIECCVCGGYYFSDA